MKTFNAKIIEKKQLTNDVIELSLEKPADFNFKAGQFVSIKIKNKDVVKMRSYSILSTISEDRLRFVIKIIKNGFASDVFENCKVGDEFEVRGPGGKFIFEDDENEYWFISTGTGIGPMYSMIMEFVRKIPNKKFKLIAGFRKKENLLYHNEFMKLENENENFEYLPTLTRDGWDGAKGKVYEHLEGDLSGKTFYICGLKEMVKDVKEKLILLKVKEENIKFEKYD